MSLRDILVDVLQHYPQAREQDFTDKRARPNLRLLRGPLVLDCSLVEAPVRASGPRCPGWPYSTRW